MADELHISLEDDDIETLRIELLELKDSIAKLSDDIMLITKRLEVLENA